MRKAKKFEDMPRVPPEEGLARLREFTRRIFAAPKQKVEEPKPEPPRIKRPRTA
jgi:hypothetical protein